MKKLIIFIPFLILFSCGQESNEGQIIPPLNFKVDELALANFLNEEIDHDPSAKNYFLRARFFFQKNKLLESLADINSAIQIDNTEPKYFLLRARVNFGLKKISAALRDAENAELQQLANPELYTFLTELYISKKQYSRALTEINKCLEISPFQYSAWLYKGVITLKNGDTTAGIELIKTSMKYGSSSNSYYQLGKVYNKLHDYKTARQYINEGLKIDSTEANLIYELAENYRLTGKTDTSKYFYYKSVKRDPELFKAYYEIGKIYFAEKNYPEALANFEKIKNKNTTFPGLDALMAYAYESSEKYQRALDQYLEVINNDLIKNGDTTNYNAIDSYWRLKKLVDALRYQSKLDSLRLIGQ